jgi:hypothetical protein
MQIGVLYEKQEQIRGTESNGETGSAIKKG